LRRFALSGSTSIQEARRPVVSDEAKIKSPDSAQDPPHILTPCFYSLCFFPMTWFIQHGLYTSAAGGSKIRAEVLHGLSPVFDPCPSVLICGGFPPDQSEPSPRRPVFKVIQSNSNHFKVKKCSNHFLSFRIQSASSVAIRHLQLSFRSSNELYINEPLVRFKIAGVEVPENQRSLQMRGGSSYGFARTVPTRLAAYA
jgi:hypothetical protein